MRTCPAGPGRGAARQSLLPPRRFHLITPSPINPLGVKGAGEDALRPLGARLTRLPLNPARIGDLIHRA